MKILEWKVEWQGSTATNKILATVVLILTVASPVAFACIGKRQGEYY